MVVGEGASFMIVAWGKLYHRSVWGLLRYPEGRLNEDEYVTYRVMYACDTVALVRARLYGHTRRPDSIMGSLGARSLDALEGLRDAVRFFEERGDADLACWARKRYAFHLMTCYYRIAVAPDRDDGLLGEVRDRYRAFMRRWGREVWRRADALLRLQLAVFAASPALYVRLSARFVRDAGRCLETGASRAEPRRHSLQ